MSRLKRDSPSLIARLGKLYQPSEIEELAVLYDQLAPQKDHWDSALNRSSTSYNPLPARACEIMLNCFDQPSINQLKAAMLISTAENGRVVEKGDKETCHLAKSAVNFLYDRQNTGNIDPASLEVALGVLLDRLRHLHMTNLSIEEKIAFCRDVEDRILPVSPAGWKIIPLIKRYTDRNLKS